MSTENTKPLISRAAIFARVSSEEQVQGTSLSSQVADCREKARAEGYVVEDVDIFVEEGVSGALPMEKRPLLKQVFDLIDSYHYQALYLYSPDRLSRNAVESLLYEQQAKAAGTKVVFVTESYDDTPEGQLYRGIRAHIAEYERQLISRRFLRGRQYAWSKGKFGGGRIPYGYAWNPDEGWVIDGDQASIIRQIFNAYVSSGGSLRSIVRKLNQDGIRTPRNGQYWRDSAVRSLIRQPIYIGVYYGLRGKPNPQPQYTSLEEFMTIAREREWIEVPGIPPILVADDGLPDVPLWEAAQQKRLTNRHGGTGYRTLNWPLQGRLKCPQCGRMMRCRKESNGKKRVYYCASRYEDHVGLDRVRCSTPRIDANEAELGVALALTQALATPSSVATAVKGYLRGLRLRAESLTTSAGPLVESRGQLQAQLDRLNALYIDGLMSEAQHRVKAITLKGKISNLDYSPGPSKELAEIESTIATIENGIGDGSMVARVSRINGLQILKKRDPSVGPKPRGGAKRKVGIAGVEESLYQGLVGNIEFRELLNMLGVEAVIHEDRIDIFGLIPFDQRASASDSDGSPMSNRVPLITSMGSWRRPA